MMNEYCINGLTIKENLLRLAGEGNKKFTYKRSYVFDFFS